MIVVVVIPVVLVMPTVLVFIPPAMVFTPALLAGFLQLVPFMLGLPAVPPMMLDRFMQFVVGVCDPPLAAIVDFLA